MAKIALVVLDTLRKDTFEQFFDWIPGKYYPNTYSTANWTAPAHASLFTGYYPTEVDVTAKSRRLDVKIPVLAEVLQNTGYQVDGYSANHNVSSKTNFDRGFDTFINPTELKNPGQAKTIDWESYQSRTELDGISLYLNALRDCIFKKVNTLQSIKRGIGIAFEYRPWQKSIVDEGASEVLQLLRNSHPAEDQFTFINLMETHTPYNPPSDFNTVGNSVSVTIENVIREVDNPCQTKQAYIDEAKYLSSIYQDIFNILRDNYDYIITLSDHGEMLGEFGKWNHTYGLYSELTNVPLVITKNEDEKQIVDDSVVSFIDVHQTILDFAGVSGNSRGENIETMSENTGRLCEFHGLIDIAKERLQDVGVTDEQLNHYDRVFRGLVTAGDKYEVDAEDHPNTADRKTMQKITDTVESFKQFQQKSNSQSEPIPMDHLEDLGYI